MRLWFSGSGLFGHRHTVPVVAKRGFKQDQPHLFGVQLDGPSSVLIRRRSKVRFLPRRLGKTNTIGVVADKVMHRTLNPVDVGSMPTNPTETQVSDVRSQVSVSALKPEVELMSSYLTIASFVNDPSVQPGVDAALSRRRSPVQIRYGSLE
jgi:hypothetical protein